MPLATFYNQLPLQEKMEMISAFTRPGFVNMVRMEIDRVKIQLGVLDSTDEKLFITQYKQLQMEKVFWEEVMQVITRAAQELTKHG